MQYSLKQANMLHISGESYFKLNSSCYKTERVHPPLIAEPSTRHGDLQWRNVDYFIMNGANQEDRKLILKSLNFLMACRLQII